MNKAFVICVVAVFVAGAVSAQTVRSGSVVMTLAEVEAARANGGVKGLPEAIDVNLLSNPGFEDGVLPPWTTDGWVLNSATPNSGTYAAEALGNIFVRQDFAPVDVTTVTAVTVYMTQPMAVVSQICLFYDVSDEECDIFFPTANWSQINLSSLLRGSGNLTGIRVYGYSDGTPDPDITMLDDVLIDSTVPVELQSFTVN